MYNEIRQRNTECITEYGNEIRQHTAGVLLLLQQNCALKLANALIAARFSLFFARFPRKARFPLQVPLSWRVAGFLVSFFSEACFVLSSFRLPGELQKIERITEAFARAYFQQQPPNPAPRTSRGVYCSWDSCHILTFSIIMLNTDLHRFVGQMICPN